MHRMKTRAATATAVVILLAAGCASLGSLIQPPTFAVQDGRGSELRLLGPSTSRPLGGASLRVWTRIGNPNSFGLTLAGLAGNIYLEDQHAGEVSFPLGLPLVAGGDTIVPLDVSISFADIPGLAGVAQQILLQNRVEFRLDGTVSVDAGPFGQPSFGPRTWLRGETPVIR